MDHSTRVRFATGSAQRANLYGPSATPKHGGLIYADRFGVDVPVRSAAPPPVAEYDAYLKGRNQRHVDVVHGTAKTGRRLRRIVIMRREGCTWKECGETVGVRPSTAKEWVEMLPWELAV